MCSQVVDKAGHRAHSRRGCTHIKTTTKKSRLSDGAWPLGMSCLPGTSHFWKLDMGTSQELGWRSQGAVLQKSPPPPLTSRVVSGAMI